MTNCKEAIVTPNDDGTYKIEFIGCKFMNNGEELEGNVVFPKVSKTEADTAVNIMNDDIDGINKVYRFDPKATHDEPTIFTIYIPD